MRREYGGACEARLAMKLLGFLSERDLGNMVRSNIAVNYPMTYEYLKNAKLSFGPDVTLLKGKLVRRKPDSIVNDYVEIPWEIIESRK